MPTFKRSGMVIVTLMVVLVFMLFLLGNGADAAEKKVSGTGKLAAVLASTTMSPGDDPKHVVALNRSVHVLNSSDPDFNTQIEQVAVSDLLAGSGTANGYNVAAPPGGDKWFVRWEGTTKTMQRSDGTSEAAMEGKWWFVGGTGRFKGIAGGGTYKGKPGGPYEWEGHYEIKQ